MELLNAITNNKVF